MTTTNDSAYPFSGEEGVHVIMHWSGFGYTGSFGVVLATTDAAAAEHAWNAAASRRQHARAQFWPGDMRPVEATAHHGIVTMHPIPALAAGGAQ